ncbi:MAG: DUF4129 domain-containing protein [Leeuwenhoekiella sp.]
MLRFFLYSLLFLWCHSALPQNAAPLSDSIATAQDLQYDKTVINRPNLNENDLNAYKNDDAFDYTAYLPQDNWWTRFNNWLNELWSSFIQWILNGREVTGLLEFIIRALPYLLIFGVFVFLVWLFIKADMGGSSISWQTPNKVILNSEEELIRHEDLQHLIDDAIKEGNYRMAIRYYYLLVLQNLSKKDIIDWQVQKTNHDYVYEIKDDRLREKFRKVTRIYDFIWYGDFEINDDSFVRAQQEFINVNHGI